MSAPAKLAAFAALVAASFGIGFALGEVSGPFDEQTPARPSLHEVHP